MCKMMDGCSRKIQDSGAVTGRKVPSSRWEYNNMVPAGGGGVSTHRLDKMAWTVMPHKRLQNDMAGLPGMAWTGPQTVPLPPSLALFLHLGQM